MQKHVTWKTGRGEYCESLMVHLGHRTLAVDIGLGSVGDVLQWFCVVSEPVLTSLTCAGSAVQISAGWTERHKDRLSVC